MVIDFCGPWEVFHDVSVPGRSGEAFKLYTVAQSLDPVEASGGMKIIPHYTLESAPPPKVVVIPAQEGDGQVLVEWIRKSARTADVVMSVCTGAFLLAKTGLLEGKSATTHHIAYRGFTRMYPDVQLKRGARFVEEGNLATAAGLSAGIDLALRVVERSLGDDVAKQTTYDMKYRVVDGPIRIQTRSTRNSAPNLIKVCIARSVEWTSTQRRRPVPHTEAKRTISACLNTKKSSIRIRSNS